MESWDDENFESPAHPPGPVLNKWEGEDEEEDLKDNWEDDDDEKKEEEKKLETEVKKPKKKLAERIAEKERLKREELERKLKEQEDDEDISPEEKLRRQQESDLSIALETTFAAKENAQLNDLALPETKEEFELFADTLSKKISPLAKSAEYVNFIENLTRNLCATMSSLDIKKIKNSVDNLYLEKQKIEKGEKTKKNKGKGKAKLKLEANPLSHPVSYANDYDDYDDFM